MKLAHTASSSPLLKGEFEDYVFRSEETMAEYC